MLTLNSVRIHSLKMFRRWSVRIAAVALLPVATSAQTTAVNDSTKINKEVGICGGVFLKIVELPEIAAKPSQGVFSIDESFENFNLGQQIPVYYAIREWEALIDSSGFNRSNFPITFRFGPLDPNGVLAVTVPTADGNGNLLSAEITFDNDGSTNWFIDNSPEDDSEFLSGDLPQGVGLLSVTRHEIGHALGWNTSERVTVHLSGNTFDQSLLNIATTTEGGLHTDPNVHVDDIMVPAIGTGVRRSISLYPSVAMMSQSFHYWISHLRCVANTNNASQTGSVYQPWSRVQVGVMDTPARSLLIIGPGTYNERVQSMRPAGDWLEIIAPRDATAVIIGQ